MWTKRTLSMSLTKVSANLIKISIEGKITWNQLLWISAKIKSHVLKHFFLCVVLNYQCDIINVTDKGKRQSHQNKHLGQNHMKSIIMDISRDKKPCLKAFFFFAWFSISCIFIFWTSAKNQKQTLAIIDHGFSHQQFLFHLKRSLELSISSWKLAIILSKKNNQKAAKSEHWSPNF